ncbi:hypothetical protein GN244_ATG18565 [Phytophthora infestans]|uniref:Uncharacterized protein n=1 Tax=Phytophthora infestans TaxID=4787 RepID=A0A833SKZ5_PHYIN|nr:hypothetical protein GN244_ATG18565 [Phytophthora infestans]
MRSLVERFLVCLVTNFPQLLRVQVRSDELRLLVAPTIHPVVVEMDHGRPLRAGLSTELGTLDMDPNSSELQATDATRC